MTLLDRILARGAQKPTDPIIAARLERHLRRIGPDPLFRRRLRGQVLNRYVAVREGLVTQAPARAGRRHMGVVGRGVLYASLLTAMGVSAVGAAAQGSLPGDSLYPIKLQLEAVRMLIAPPGLRDDLVAIVLDERLAEVERLAAVGRWHLVDEAADRAAQAEEQLAAMATSQSGASAASQGAGNAIERHTERLEALLADAPASARDGLRRALEASTNGAPPAVEPEREERPNIPQKPDRPEQPEPNRGNHGGEGQDNGPASQGAGTGHDPTATPSPPAEAPTDKPGKPSPKAPL